MFQIYKHRGRTDSVHIANDLLISGSADKKLQAWSMEKHEKLWEFDHGDEIRHTILRDDQLVACCDGKCIIIVGCKNGKLLKKLHTSDYCYNIDLSPNGSLLAVACNSAVEFWDIRNAVRVKEFKLGTMICDLRFNPSGDTLIAGANNGEIFKIEMK